jgi:hypothetical protein
LIIRIVPLGAFAALGTDVGVEGTLVLVIGSVVAAPEGAAL